jgi:chromatin segregation and condensation protein Rec8/ScpA/Scc1 (kleisin family)
MLVHIELLELDKEGKFILEQEKVIGQHYFYILENMWEDE